MPLRNAPGTQPKTDSTRTECEMNSSSHPFHEAQRLAQELKDLGIRLNTGPKVRNFHAVPVDTRSHGQRISRLMIQQSL